MIFASNSPEVAFKPGDTALIQADDDFVAPDSNWYRCAVGPVTFIQAKALLGFEPRQSANWFAQVGYGNRAVLIAGCRIHYAIPFPAEGLDTRMFRTAWDAREDRQ